MESEINRINFNEKRSQYEQLRPVVICLKEMNYRWLFMFQYYYTITKTRLFKYIENVTTKNWKCPHKNSDSFHIIAQNIDCGYSLVPPRGSNEYPQFMLFEHK